MHRRDFLKRTAAMGVALTAPGVISSSVFAAQIPANPIDLSAIDLSRAIRERNVSCVEVMQAYLQQIHQYNPVYNAIISMRDDDSLIAQAREADAALARGEYRGWMHGFPHAVKELAALKGFRHTSGSPLFADRVADEDDAMVARIRAAGAIFIGKTNAPEFGLGSQSYNPIFGATGSAYNPALTSGGSSGGAACGLGTHMLPSADGSDMMGSLRNPAAYNNVIGFRPSTNVIFNDTSPERALATLGPMGRNTADTIRLLNTIAAKPMPERLVPLPLKDLRIGWLGNLGGYLAMEPGVLALCEASLNIVVGAGAKVVPANLGMKPADLWTSWTTLRHSGRVGMKALYENPARRALMKPELIWEIEQGLALTDQDREEANRIREDWYAELDKLFTTFDFLVMPSAQLFPFSRDIHWPKEINGTEMDTYHRWMEVVVPASLGGLPSLNVPVGFDADDRPMGMQVIGQFGNDEQVLAFGLAFEAITSFLAHRPRLRSEA